jgi:sugar transferase (PEP-CTERM system associated)
MRFLSRNLDVDLADIREKKAHMENEEGFVGLPLGFNTEKEEALENRVAALGSPRYRLVLLLGDVAFIILACVVSVWIRTGFAATIDPPAVVAFSFTLFVYPMTLYIFDLYNPERTFRSLETALRSCLAILLGGILAMFLFYFVAEGQYARVVMSIQVGVAWLFLNAWRWGYGALFQATLKKIPTLVVGAGYCGKAISDLVSSPFSRYEIKGFLDDDRMKQGQIISGASVIGPIDQLKRMSAHVGASTAILAIPKNRSSELIETVLDAKMHGVNVKEMADVYEELTGRIPIQFIVDQWLLFADGFSLLHNDYMQKIKRLIDVTSSALLLLLTAPLLGSVALAVRIESEGPVIYRQKRVGKGGKIFTIYKFRSMSQDAERGGARWAAKGDTRVTRIGKWLRLTHIDELPQIWNIFNGDMSLIGPRPERPEFVSRLEEKVPYYGMRHSVRPGITGWAQISYPYGASLADSIHKLECDLYYVKNMSLLLDLKIMLRTVGVVFLADGSR